MDLVHSLVHSLKGIAGNLAATELHATAIEMETLVKQRILLPHQLPQIEDPKLAVHYETSRYGAGGYYDIVQLLDDRWGFMITDAADNTTL